MNNENIQYVYFIFGPLGIFRDLQKQELISFEKVMVTINHADGQQR